MEKRNMAVERVKCFLLGVLAVVGVLLLSGASERPALPNGRYQIAAWGDHQAHGAFVVDTATGEAKIAYRYRMVSETEANVRSNLDLPFSAIR